MAFTLPHFPLAVNVWHFGTDPAGAPDATITGNLIPGRRTFATDSLLVPAAGSPLPQMYLLFPKADVLIGDVNSSGMPDTLEIAAGDGWYYRVHYVDRVARGFSNEHAIAVLTFASQGAPPLPPAGGDMLQEDGTDVLLEDGTPILIE